MKRGMAWPTAVAGVLCLTVAANIWLIRVASSDPSFAVEEDYYQRGLRWDDEMAQRSRNVTLGWHLLATVAPIESGRGAELRVALNDAAIAPISGASVVVRAFHIGRAGQTVDVTLAPTAAGEYRATVPIERPGLWELRFDVRRGSDHFTALERVDTRSAQP
jgi:nitrogen fixation protein FixH